MRVEQVAALARERQAALTVAKVNRFDKALVAQVVERRRARIAARESKATAGAAAALPGGAPNGRAAQIAELTARARAAGHPV